MYLFKLPNHLRIKSWRDNILGTADVTHIFHLINKNSTLFKLYTYIYPKPWKIKNLRKTDVKSHSRENKGGKKKNTKIDFWGSFAATAATKLKNYWGKISGF